MIQTFDIQTPLWQLTIGQFEELIRGIVPVAAVVPASEEVYFTTKEAADYLKVSISTIHRWNDSKYLPSLKKGGILRFRKSDLDKISR